MAPRLWALRAPHSWTMMPEAREQSRRLPAQPGRSVCLVRPGIGLVRSVKTQFVMAPSFSVPAWRTFLLLLLLWSRDGSTLHLRNFTLNSDSPHKSPTVSSPANLYIGTTIEFPTVTPQYLFKVQAIPQRTSLERQSRFLLDKSPRTVFCPSIVTSLEPFQSAFGQGTVDLFGYLYRQVIPPINRKFSASFS